MKETGYFSYDLILYIDFYIGNGMTVPLSMLHISVSFKNATGEENLNFETEFVKQKYEIIKLNSTTPYFANQNELE